MIWLESQLSLNQPTGPNPSLSRNILQLSVCVFVCSIAETLHFGGPETFGQKSVALILAYLLNIMLFGCLHQGTSFQQYVDPMCLYFPSSTGFTQLLVMQVDRYCRPYCQSKLVSVQCSALRCSVAVYCIPAHCISLQYSVMHYCVVHCCVVQNEKPPASSPLPPLPPSGLVVQCYIHQRDKEMYKTLFVDLSKI